MTLRNWVYCSWSQWPCSATWCPATEEGIPRNWVLIPPWISRRIHTEIELLAQVLASPVLRPDVPHAHIVQRHVDCRPRLGVDLKTSRSISPCYTIFDKMIDFSHSSFASKVRWSGYYSSCSWFEEWSLDLRYNNHLHEDAEEVAKRQEMDPYQEF